MTEDDLVRQWQGFAYSIADGYYLPGSGFDDVRQEALLGLLAAIRDYRPGLGRRFPSFVRLCVERRVIEAVRLATRQKHRPISEAVRVVVSDEGKELVDAFEIAPSNLGRDPHLVAVEHENVRELTARARTLTATERRAIGGVTSGYTYCEIEGVPEGEKPKWVDNAVQRARRKLAA